MKPRYRFTAFVLLIAFVLMVGGILRTTAQTKEIAADKKPAPVVTPFTLEESNTLTQADATIRAKDQELADLNMKIANAVIQREAARSEFNQIAAKYPNEQFQRDSKGIYTGHKLEK